MDGQPVSELLPGLYRAVLDAVANLESVGRRHEAAEIRAEATRVYSKEWTTGAAMRLRNLALRAGRIVDARRRPGPDLSPELAFESLTLPVDLERRTA